MSFLDSLIYGIRSIKKGDVELPTRNALNFSGGVTVVDNPAKNQTEITVTGGGGGASDASDVSYDNSLSGIVSDNVQDALDEVVSMIGSGGGDGISQIDTLALLRDIDSSSLTDTSIYLVRETGILWRYDPSSGADEIDDGGVSVKPDDIEQEDPGRWRPVTHTGYPGLSVPGLGDITFAKIPANLLRLNAQPIIDEAEGGPPLFAGMTVDIGDEDGIKKPAPIFGLNPDGRWVVGDIDWSTLNLKQSLEIRQDKLILADKDYPTRDGYTIEVYHAGTDEPAKLSLKVKAGGNRSHDGTGGDIYVMPGKSGPGSVRKASAHLADENGTPVVSATNDKLGFFNTYPVARPVVSGSWGDGSAMQSMLAALVTLGLVEDQTTP